MIPNDLTQPVKPIVYKLAKDDSRKICSFIIPDNKVGSLQLEIKKHNNGFGYNFITELKNKFGKLLGFEEFAFFENAKNFMWKIITLITLSHKRKPPGNHRVTFSYMIQLYFL